MDRLEREGLVLRNELSFVDILGSKGERLQVQLTGWIECRDRVRIFVDKWMEVGVRDDGRESVRTYSYSYHGCFRDGREILRYDSAHGLADLHRHRIDPASGHEVREGVALDALPTLDGVIRETLDLAQAILANDQDSPDV